MDPVSALDYWAPREGLGTGAPMPRIRHADALDPVDVHTAPLAVQDQLPEFPLQVGLHLQEFQPHLLGGHRTG